MVNKTLGINPAVSSMAKGSWRSWVHVLSSLEKSLNYNEIASAELHL